MRFESRKFIHMGINYIFPTVPVIDKRHLIDFQSSLVDRGIEYTSATEKEHQIEVVRQPQAPLQVTVAALQPQPLGQLLVLASPARERRLQDFIADAESVVDAFEATWPATRRELIKCDAALRVLYQTDAGHAFQELWEQWLGQPPLSPETFGRPVLGGGLRFVVPEAEDELDLPQIEIKIESYLRNARLIFVETQFVWPQPKLQGTGFDVASRMQLLNNYERQQVQGFVRERTT